MDCDIFLCNGCKKNPFKKDRCSCLDVLNDNLTYKIFFTSLVERSKAITFLVDSVIDNVPVKNIVENLKSEAFDRYIKQTEQKKETFKLNKKLTSYVIQYTK